MILGREMTFTLVKRTDSTISRPLGGADGKGTVEERLVMEYDVGGDFVYTETDTFGRKRTHSLVITRLELT